MAAQLMEAAREQLGETLSTALARGDYAPLRCAIAFFVAAFLMNNDSLSQHRLWTSASHKG
jgi:hypothetical protein